MSKLRDQLRRDWPAVACFIIMAAIFSGVIWTAANNRLEGMMASNPANEPTRSR